MEGGDSLSLGVHRVGGGQGNSRSGSGYGNIRSSYGRSSSNSG